MKKWKWEVLVVLVLFILAAACGPAPETGDETDIRGTDIGESGGLGGAQEETGVPDLPTEAPVTPTSVIGEVTEAPPAQETATEPASEPTAAESETPLETAAATSAGITGPAACASGLSLDAMMTTGEQIYSNSCASCHGPEGQGAGSFPPLAGNSNVTAEDATEMLLTFVDPTVHPFITQFDGDDLAAVLTYVRSSFGNEAPTLCPEDIEALTGG